MLHWTDEIEDFAMGELCHHKDCPCKMMKFMALFTDFNFELP